MKIGYKEAVKIKDFLKKNDFGEYLDTFGDMDPDDLGAIDVIMANHKDMASNWLQAIGTPEAIELFNATQDVQRT